MRRMQEKIFHTRIKRTTNIANVRTDQYNPMTLIIDFDHTIPTNYFLPEPQVIYAAYVDRVFVKEFLEKSTKIQLGEQDVNHLLEIFAHPHGGFRFIRNSLVPGNKIRITYQALDPSQSDVKQHKIYWDAGSGTISTAILGTVDPVTGQVSGNLKSGKILS